MTDVNIFIKGQYQAGPSFRSASQDISRLGRDTRDLSQRLNASQAALTGLATAGFNAGFSAVGAGVRGAIGAVVELNNANNELNAGLANVQSLGVSQQALAGYRNEIQALSLEVGQGTGGLTDGLYQVVSAFGESSESAEILAINAKAATAGIATIEDAIALTSAVTKGYNDTTAEAIQKTADLAFKTVELGQTNFPQLARSMGQFIPIASALGVEQETLFAQFATLTGVTGSTSEVATQLKNAFQQVIRPTNEMAGALSEVAGGLEDQGRLVNNDFTRSWREARRELAANANALHGTTIEMLALEEAGEKNSGRYKELSTLRKEQEKLTNDQSEAVQELSAALGRSVVESVGANEALLLLTDTADGNTNTLGKMFGSVEALNAVLALSGAQSEDFARKYEEMQDVVGAADAAFEAQTAGVNSSGFALKQLGAAAQVLKEDLGGAGGSIFAPLLEDAAKLATEAVPLVTQSLNDSAPAIQDAVASWFNGGEPISLSELITFDLSNDQTSFVNVGDFFKFQKMNFTDLVDQDASSTSISLSSLFTFEKLTTDDLFDLDISAFSDIFTFKKLTADDLIETDFAIDQLFSFEQKIDPSGIFTKKVFLDDIFVIESQISADDLFGTTKYTFADLFSFESTIGFDGLFGTNKFAVGDLFDFTATWSPVESIQKLTLGDIFTFEQGINLADFGEFTKLSFGDLVNFETAFLPESFANVTKLNLGDIVDFESFAGFGENFTKLNFFGDIVQFEGNLFEGIQTEKLTIGDIFELDFASNFASGLTETKIRIGDLFDGESEFNLAEGFGLVKLGFGDIFDTEISINLAEQMALTKFKFGDLIEAEFDFGSLSFSKLQIGDVLDVSGFSDLFSGVGEQVSQTFFPLGGIQIESAQQDVPEFAWPELPEFAWPTLPEFAWPSLPDWTWPSLPDWSWPSLPSWSWPSIPKPGWIDSLTGALGFSLGGPVRQSGVYNFNEFGQEGVVFPSGSSTFLPRGAEVIPANQLAGAGAGGPPISITIPGLVVRSEADIDTLARAVVQRIGGRR